MIGFIAFFISNSILNFKYGYDIGYTCAQDTLEYPESYRFGEFTEGGFDYWETKSFWIEQGYEEGYKKGARDYFKDNSIYSFNINLTLHGLTDNGSFIWTLQEVKSELLECFEDFALKIEVKKK